jgi:hypothetical protein
MFVKKKKKKKQTRSKALKLKILPIYREYLKKKVVRLD